MTPPPTIQSSLASPTTMTTQETTTITTSRSLRSGEKLAKSFLLKIAKKRNRNIHVAKVRETPAILPTPLQTATEEESSIVAIAALTTAATATAAAAATNDRLRLRRRQRRTALQ